MTDKKYIPNGYILLSRNLIESEIWNKPPMYLKVWTYILIKARHKTDTRKGFERGECLISIPELQEKCSHRVGYRTVKPSKDQIFNIIEWLRSVHEDSHEYDYEDDTNPTMITTTKTTRGLVIKVRNYNVYQDPKNYEYNGGDDNEDSTKTTTKESRIQQQADTIHKNVKELKKEKNEKNVESIVCDDDPAFNNLLSLYKDNIEKEPKPITVNKLKKDYKQYGEEILNYAIEKSTLSGNEDYRFINHLLNDWNKNGLKTIVDVQTFEDERQGGKSNQDDVFKRVAAKYSDEESRESKWDRIYKELNIQEEEPQKNESYEKTPEWLGKEPIPSEPANEEDRKALEEQVNDFWADL